MNHGMPPIVLLLGECQIRPRDVANRVGLKFAGGVGADGKRLVCLARHIEEAQVGLLWKITTAESK